MFKYLEKSTDTDIVSYINNDIWNKGWCSAKAIFIQHIRKELEKRNIDYSAIWDKSYFSLKNKIILEDKTIKIIT